MSRGAHHWLMASLPLSSFSRLTLPSWPTTSISTPQGQMTHVLFVKLRELWRPGHGQTADPLQAGGPPPGLHRPGQQLTHCHILCSQCMHGGGIDLVFPDLIHCKHLGTDQLLVGSVLTRMIKHYMPGKVSQNLAMLWAFMQDWHKAAWIQGGVSPSTRSASTSPTEMLSLPCLGWAGWLLQFSWWTPTLCRPQRLSHASSHSSLCSIHLGICCTSLLESNPMIPQQGHIT